MKFLKPLLPIKTFGDNIFADHVTNLQKLVSEKGFLGEKKIKNFRLEICTKPGPHNLLAFEKKMCKERKLHISETR